MDGEVLVPVLAAEIGERQGEALAEVAGVVDHDVHLPEVLDCLPYHLRAVGLAGHVADDRQTAPARLLGGRHRLLRSLQVEV